MANTLRFFMAPEDELAFLRYLERFPLEVYPVRVPTDWVPFKAGSDKRDQLPEGECYLAASDLGDVQVDKVKRGRDKGSWRIDEVRSPVIHFERSATNEAGELLSGKMWAELEVTQQTGRRDPAPEKFRVRFLEMEQWLKKAFRKGDPKEFWIGPRAARMFKEGLLLRDSAFRGSLVEPHR